jgi:NitT/TauT family transport system substrate-binding protein
MLTVALGLLAALAISPPHLALGAEKVKLGYTAGPDFLAAFTAQDQGFFAQHGIDMELQFVAQGATIPAALQTDGLQIGTPTVPAVLLAGENGLDFKIIAGNIQTGPGFHLAAIIARPDLVGRDAKLLEGKTVGVPGVYTFMHILLVKWLGDHWADPAKVHFVEVPIPNMPDTLRAGQVDAVVPVDPFMSRLIGSGAGRPFAYYIDDFPAGIVPTVYVVARRYAEEHPAVIAGFRAAVAEGLAWHLAHPEAAPETLSRYLKLPPEIAKTLPLPHYITAVSATQIKFWADIMTEEKLLTRPFDPESVLLR